MNTATHLVVAAAALTRPRARRANAAAVAGALLPDAWIFAFYGWSRASGLSERAIWRDTYWSEPWQTVGAVANSAPLAALCLGAGLAMRRPWVAALALAWLSHLALDFPVHAEDAHRHFWPISDWRFRAPFSYWDERHHAGVVRWVELALLAVGSVVLWRRFEGRGVRAALGVGAAAFVAPYFWFALVL
ncbi:MAG: cobalamin biosynthesis protein CobQ [Paracoccaceae bacterium]